MAIAVDASTPVRFTGTPNIADTLTSASFTAPTDALLVLTMQCEATGSNLQYTVSDSGGLTWTTRVEHTQSESITGGGHVSIHTARTTSSASRTVTITRTGTGGGNGTRVMTAKLYVLTGVDVDGTPVDTVGANNEGGSTTNNLTTSSVTPGANGLLIAADFNYADFGGSVSADLTYDAASPASTQGPYNVDVLSGYKTVSSGVGATANIDAGGTASAEHNWVQIVVREAASGSDTITPSAGSQALTGISPVVTQQFNRTPSVGALALTGIAPLVLVSGIIQPSAGSLALTGNAPVVTQQVTITPTAGSLSLTGIAPSVAASGNVSITPSTGSLALTGGTVEQTLTVPPPTAAALALTGIAPVVTQGTVRVPTAGSLSLTGIAPTVTVAGSMIITPSAGALSIIGVAPNVQDSGAPTDPATPESYTVRRGGMMVFG